MTMYVTRYQKIINIFYPKIGVRQLALFGSAITGNFHPESDLDSLVVININTVVSFILLGRITREHPVIFQRSVDRVLYKCY